MKKNKKTGFTLVEAIVTIVLLTILTAISVPIYDNYVGKAIYAEAYTFLGAIREAQLLYRSEYGNFWSSTSTSDNISTDYDPVLKVNAKLNKYFTWFQIGNKRYYDCNTGFMARVPKPVAYVKGGKNYL